MASFYALQSLAVYGVAFSYNKSTYLVGSLLYYFLAELDILRYEFETQSGSVMGLGESLLDHKRKRAMMTALRPDYPDVVL